jgi:hypothetical protein
MISISRSRILLLATPLIAGGCKDRSPSRSLEPVPPVEQPFSVSTFSPTSGDMEGCTTVTLTGVGFVLGTQVSFGGAHANVVSVVDGTTMVVTTTLHRPGGVSLTVTRPDGRTATPPGYYQYVDYGDKSAGCWDY